MIVELLSAALQQQSGFSSPEEMLEKLMSLQLPLIEGSVTSRRSAAAESSVYELMRKIFRFSTYEEPVRQMLRQLSLLSPLGMDRDLFLKLIGRNNNKDVGDSEKAVRNTLLRLRELHLVTIDPRTAHISMHPVLSDVATADLQPDENNCGVMITNAVQYFDEDSPRRYEARQLEQISAMCKRCAMLLSGYSSKSDAAMAVSETTPVSERGASSADTEILSGSESTPVTVRLSLTVSGIDYRLGNYRAAASWAERALLCYGDDSTPSVQCQAESLKCAARAYAKLGLYEKACECYEKELDLLPADMKRELAISLNDYGVLLEEMGLFEEANDCLLEAWEIQKDLYGPDSPETISTCNNLGLVCADTGNLEAAETFYRHALRIALEYYKEGHPETAVMYSNLGELLMHSCEDSEDDEEVDESAEAGLAEARLAETGLAEARLAESRHYLLRALEIYTNAYGPCYPESACTLSNLGILEDIEGNHKKAREHYRKALEIQRAVAGNDHPHCADILHNLGVSYIDEALEPFPSAEAFSAAPVDQKRDALPFLRKALACEQKALSILEAVFGTSHNSVVMLRNEVEWLENEV